MSKTINKIVWDIFIEESMGDNKANEYSDRIKDYTEDMCYIIYRNMTYKIDRGENINDISFEDVLPRELLFTDD